jgi:heme exporter protein B
MSGFWTCFGREWRLALRRSGDILTVVMFFAITLSLFPFGLGAGKALLQQTAPAIVWVVAMLAVLLNLDSLFGRDERSGMLDQILLAPLMSLEYAMAKWLVSWLLTALPLVIMTPVMTLLYFLPGNETWLLVLSLLLGTPSLTSLGIIAASLALGARKGSLLVPLIALPLMIPVLIFGVGTVTLSQQQMNAASAWYALAGLAFLLLPLSLGTASLALHHNRS